MLEFLDEDVIYNPAFWILSMGAIVALLIGFKASSLWGTEIGIPLFSKVIIIILTPIVAYFVVMKISRR